MRRKPCPCRCRAPGVPISLPLYLPLCLGPGLTSATLWPRPWPCLCLPRPPLWPGLPRAQLPKGSTQRTERQARGVGQGVQVSPQLRPAPRQPSPAPSVDRASKDQSRPLLRRRGEGWGLQRAPPTGESGVVLILPPHRSEAPGPRRAPQVAGRDHRPGPSWAGRAPVSSRQTPAVQLLLHKDRVLQPVQQWPRWGRRRGAVSWRGL